MEFHLSLFWLIDLLVFTLALGWSLGITADTKLKMCLSLRCVFNPEKSKWHMHAKKDLECKPKGSVVSWVGIKDQEKAGGLRLYSCIRCNCSEAASFEMGYCGEQSCPWVTHVLKDTLNCFCIYSQPLRVVLPFHFPLSPFICFAFSFCHVLLWCPQTTCFRGCRCSI